MRYQLRGRGWGSLVGLLLILSIFTAACSSGKPEATDPQTPKQTDNGGNTSATVNKVFRYNFSYDYAGARLDIAKGYTILAPNVFVGLTRIDPNNQIIPGAAESWSTSADGRVYTFKLNRSMKWSDGQPVTAHDFAYGWLRGLDPATKSVRAWMLYLIEGAEAYNKGTGPREAVGVKAVDDYTLEVKLVRPAPFFPAYAAANNIYFSQPKHVIEKHGDKWVQTENVVFSGPFVVSEYKPGSLAVMTPNPNWPGKKPNVTRVEYYVVPDAATVLGKYEAGELDFAMGLPIGEIDLITKDDKLKSLFTVLPESRVMTLQLNTTKQPWNNQKVRQAIFHAIDQTELTKGPFRGVFRTSESLRPPEMPGGNFAPLKGFVNVEKAKQLLSEAGFPGGQGFPEVSILVPNQEDSVIAADYLQDRLTKTLGLKVKVEVMESVAFLDKVQSGQGDVIWLSALFSLSPDLYDLYAVAEGSAANNSLWKDKTFSDMLVQASTEPDPAKRIALYDTAEKYLVLEQAIMLPLWVTDRTALISPKVVGLKEDKRSIWSHTWEYIDIK